MAYILLLTINSTAQAWETGDDSPLAAFQPISEGTDLLIAFMPQDGCRVAVAIASDEPEENVLGEYAEIEGIGLFANIFMRKPMQLRVDNKALWDVISEAENMEWDGKAIGIRGAEVDQQFAYELMEGNTLRIKVEDDITTVPLKGSSGDGFSKLPERTGRI